MKDITEIKEEFERADKFLKQAEEDIANLQKMVDSLPTMIQNMKELEGFYFSEDFLQKVQFLEENEADIYASTSQDGIWNSSFEFQSLLLEVMKIAVDRVYERGR